MGYFSNGTEAMIYEETYCKKCLHNKEEERCPVLLAHWDCASNKDAQFHVDSSPERLVLDAFIPRDVDGVNQQCTMMMEIDIEIISKAREPDPVPCARSVWI